MAVYTLTFLSTDLFSFSMTPATPQVKVKGRMSPYILRSAEPSQVTAGKSVNFCLTVFSRGTTL